MALSKQSIGKIVASVAIAFVATGASLSTDWKIFDTLKRGSWELRTLTGEETRRKICFQDPIAMVQIYHPQEQCTQHVIVNEADRFRVNYSCSASGSGRTNIRRESSGLVKITTQAIANNMPRSTQIEARYVGSC